MKSPPANTGDARDPDWIPGSGRSSGGGNGNPLETPSRARASSCQAMGTTWFFSCLFSPALPGRMAAHGSEAEPGGAGGLWVAGTRKELVCWFSLKAQAVGINRSTQGGLQKEQVALGQMKGSLWRSSLQPPPPTARCLSQLGK